MSFLLIFFVILVIPCSETDSNSEEDENAKGNKIFCMVVYLIYYTVQFAFK